MDQENKKPEPPKNLLEKLIRLDKKNSNFNMQDFEMKYFIVKLFEFEFFFVERN